MSDVERALRFYTAALGLPEVPRPPTFDTPGAWVAVGDQQLPLIGETEPGRARAMHPGYDPAEVAIGYGNHVALVVDATLVRAVLVPATMRLLGDANWYAPPPIARWWASSGLREHDGPSQPRPGPKHRRAGRPVTPAAAPREPGAPARELQPAGHA